MPQRQYADIGQPVAWAARAAAVQQIEAPSRPEVAGPERRGSIFHVNGKPPERVVFAVRAESCDGVAPSTPMGRALAGVLDERTGEGVPGLLGNLVESGTRVREETTLATPICVAWLFAGGQSKRIEIGRTGQGWLLAREMDAG